MAFKGANDEPIEMVDRQLSPKYYLNEMYNDDSFKLKPKNPTISPPKGMGPVYNKPYNKDKDKMW
jgi:hypothetical protein